MVSRHKSMGVPGESIDRVWHSGALGVEAKAHKYSATTHCRAAPILNHPGIGLRSEILLSDRER